MHKTINMFRSYLLRFFFRLSVMFVTISGYFAYDKAPLTKAERANNVRKRGYLYKYSGLAQEVLSALLDKYMNEGIQDIENLEILSNDPFRKFGTPMKIAKLFGGKNGYIQAIRDLQKEIYAA